MINWSIEAASFGNCNCDYSCPCQFERRPTQGNCRGFEVGRIERGHFGRIALDGLCYACVYAWPGAIYEGNGTMQVIIDECADEEQRKALATVLCGGETEAGKTHWWVYRAMSTTVHEPIVKPIDFEVDIERRTARVSIPTLLESTGRPILSPATGGQHRVRIGILNGIEFEIAEIGSASTKVTGFIGLDLNDSYGRFNTVRHSGTGVVHSHWMARYFFYVSNSHTYKFSKDEAGRRFADPEDAKAHAVAVAEELAQDEDWGLEGYSVVVTDEHGTEIARVPVNN